MNKANGAQGDPEEIHRVEDGPVIHYFSLAEGGVVKQKSIVASQQDLPVVFVQEKDAAACQLIVKLKMGIPDSQCCYLGYCIEDRCMNGSLLLLQIYEDKACGCNWRYLDCHIRRILTECDNVEWVERNYLGHAQISYGPPDDPDLDKQWGLTAIDAHRAWKEFEGADLPRTLVAVVDSGMDYKHQDLKDNVAWPQEGLKECGPSDPATMPRAVFRAVHADTSPGDGAAKGNKKCCKHSSSHSEESQDPPTDEEHSHGTYCAGVIGAVAGNAIGVAGVYWRPLLMPFKFIGEKAWGSFWDASRAIFEAVEWKAEIILAAWGSTGFSRCLYEACEYARENQVLIVAAAGNLNEDIDRHRFFPACYKLEHGPFYRDRDVSGCRNCRRDVCSEVPSAKKCCCCGLGTYMGKVAEALRRRVSESQRREHEEKNERCRCRCTCDSGNTPRGKKREREMQKRYEGLDNIIVVGATIGVGFADRRRGRGRGRETKAHNSSWGREVVDLGAPGHFIRTTRRNHKWDEGGARLGWASGTSMAAAFVVGALALLKARYHDLDYLQLKDRLLRTAERVPSLESYWPYGRRLNVYRALVAEYDGYGNYRVPGEDEDDEAGGERDITICIRCGHESDHRHGGHHGGHEDGEAGTGFCICIRCRDDKPEHSGEHDEGAGSNHDHG